LDGLASLVEKNLIQQKEDGEGELRFVMLEMIHEYAREQLRAGGEEVATQRRHAQYFVDLAELAEPEFRRAGYEHWSRRLEADIDNLRAALEWSLTADVELGVRLAGALCLFWYGKGYHVEGQQWTHLLLDRLDEAPRLYHPKFLVSAGHMAFLYDLDAGKPLFMRAVAIAREDGDRLQTALALALLGYTMLAEPRAATTAVQESLVLFRELEHQPGMAQAHNIMGEIARFNGDDESARRAYEECLALCAETGERRRIVFMYGNLAYIAVHEGELDRAAALARQGLRLAREMSDRLLMATMLPLVAGSMEVAGQPRIAARLLGAFEGALQRMGAFQQLNDKRELDRLITPLREQLGEAVFQVALEEGRALSLEEAVAELLA
jgi:hypothetical protein